MGRWKSGKPDIMLSNLVFLDKMEKQKLKRISLDTGSWAEWVSEILKGYQLKEIWNANEARLFWRPLLDKLLSVAKVRCKGGNHAKQRIRYHLLSMPRLRKNLSSSLEAT